ncbi:MAG: CoA ester lyase [Pseudomonadota bacterium]
MSLPRWRSMLFVPATAERFVAKAHSRRADAIIVDLEDAVALAEKPRARGLLPSVVSQVGQGGADVVVRINRPLRMAIADLEAAVCKGVHTLMLPKADGAQHVALLHEVVSELEAERGLPLGGIRFFPLIETVDGLYAAREVAASPRVVAMGLGGEDFADAMGMPGVRAEDMLPYLRQMQVAARAAGVLAVGYAGSIANFSDLDAYATDIAEARAMGMDGGTCIHPAQVAVLNTGFSPTEAEIGQARRIVDAYDAALARGEGAIEVDGKMIDVPVANRARRLLSRA